MVIKSYLVYPIEGQMSVVTRSLHQVEGCEPLPSTNENVIVLVTESADEAADSVLESEIRALPNIQSVTLVTGHNEQ